MKIDTKFNQLQSKVQTEVTAWHLQRGYDREQGIVAQENDRMRIDCLAPQFTISRKFCRAVVKQRRSLLSHMAKNSVETVFMKRRKDVAMVGECHALPSR